MDRNLLQIDRATKSDLLASLKTQLKIEFIGIDEPIDRVVDAISMWYLYPELQERPTVVNLWGLTGTGKTSLVKRIVELLHIKKFLRFDMGEAAEQSWSVRTNLENIYHNSRSPKQEMVIVLDEFHLAYGKNSKLSAAPSTSFRMIWELLDSGKFTLPRQFDYDMYTVQSYLQALKRAKIEGVKGIKGKITDKLDTFNLILKKLEIFYSELDGKAIIINKIKDTLFRQAKSEFSEFKAFETYLNHMDLDQSIDFVSEMVEMADEPKNVDLSASIIFVIGNMDKVYSINSSSNPDDSADEFHEESKKINITHIKAALHEKFRDEQIARLGNNHVIYPAFNTDSYRKLIAMELNKVSDKFEKSTRLKIVFASSVRELIFKEGVFPSQGTRPIYTTIHQILSSNLVSLINYRDLNYPNEKRVLIDYKNGRLNGFSETNDSFKWECVPSLNLEHLRKSKQDNRKALVSVHESGHAILVAFFHGQLPNFICSDSLDGQNSGYVFIKNENELLSFLWAKNQLIVYFGGLIAEELIFGEDTSFGSQCDLKNATILAKNAIQKFGLGHFNGIVKQSEEEEGFINYHHETEKQALELLNEAKSLAKLTLLKQKRLLINMSAKLYENRTINQSEMRSLLEKYVTDDVDLEFLLSKPTAGNYKEMLLNAIHAEKIVSSYEIKDELILNI
jgi:hypothetical protein